MDPARPLDPKRLWEIRGQYYDLDPYLAEHPGGRRFLEQLRGTDCTAVFESTHLHDRMPKAMMARFRVGANPNASDTFDWDADGFFGTVKRRVREHFEAEAKQRGLPRDQWRSVHHGTPAFIARLFALWAIWGALGVGAIVYGYWWCALPWGLFAFALGGYGHEAMHAGIFRSVWANRLVALLTLDLQGLSSYVFTAIHVPLHHVYTNVKDIDPDIEVHFPLVRERPEQPHYWFHRAQWIYAWIIYMITLPALWVNDFVTVTTGVWFGPYGRIRKPGLRESLYFLVFKVLSFTLFYAGPFWFHPWPQALGIAALMLGGGGLAVQTTFALNHQNERAMGLFRSRETPRDWGALQVETTADFHHGGWLPATFFGGLGYQLEHHLFPTLSYSQLDRVAPIVRAACAEFGLPYHYYPTVLHALAGHARFLYRASLPAPVNEPREA
jgi:fatty acid desaturase